MVFYPFLRPRRGGCLGFGLLMMPLRLLRSLIPFGWWGTHRRLPKRKARARAAGEG